LPSTGTVARSTSIKAFAAAAFGIMTKAVGDYHRLYHDVRIQLREEANAFVTAAVKQNEVELGVASLPCDAARLPLDN
jgi:DNA-binding transcriptional LysR family regulator